MIALYILGTLFLLIVALTFIRVGMYISFGQELQMKVKIGPVTKQILPKQEKRNQTQKKKKTDNDDEKEIKKNKKMNLTFEDIRAAFPALMESLKRGLRKTRKRTKIHPLHLSVVFGDVDPSKVAEMYGWGCTVLWTVMPQFEKCFRIPDPHIHLDVDFRAAKTCAEGEIGLSLLIRDGIAIGWCFGIPLLKWYLSVRRGKSSQKQDTTVNGVQLNENKGE